VRGDFVFMKRGADPKQNDLVRKKLTAQSTGDA
jgi:hypothetical protein